MSQPVRSRAYQWQDPLQSAGLMLTMSGLEALQAMLRGEIAPPPIAQTLDFVMTEAAEGRVVFACTPAEFHYNPIGMVHGGLAATLLDSAMGCAVMSMLPVGMTYTTVELHVNLVRALTMQTGRVTCTAHILHSGRQLATAEARITDAAGKLYAHGSTTCLNFPLPQPG